MYEKLYSPKEISEMFGVKRQTVYNWIYQGCPTAIKQNKLVRLRYDDVLQWVRARTQDG